MRALALAVALVVGCFDPAIANRAFRCADDEPYCPDGQTCGDDGFCVDPDTIEAGAPDAGDAGADGPFEKEAPKLVGSARPEGVSCLDDNREPPDNYGDAIELAVGSHDNLQICWDGDLDYFLVEVEEGERLEVTVSFSHDAGDIDAVMKAPPQKSARVLDLGQSVNDDEHLTMSDPAPDSGDYRIAVFGYGGAVNSYSLTIAISSP
ncbi:MAG: hypothetical protein AABZ30_08210 [Myxococcota bacterium]